MSRALVRIGLIVFIGVVVLVWVGTVIQRDSPSSPQRSTTPQPKNFARRLETKVVEDQLLRMGYDVQVTCIEEDDSKMIVYGKSVDRPFARNLMARRDFKKILPDGKFTEVTFMDSMSFPGFVRTYAVK
jgi:hypothetical protein